MARKRCKLCKCPLYGKVEVPYAGNKKARIVLIGESPGWEEERDGKPFVGDSGQLAQRVSKQAGLKWADLFIMNSARCRIDKSSMSNKQITSTLTFCRKYVVEAITLLKPSVIICCGDIALRQILRRSGIKKNHGKWTWSKEFNCWVMPTYHPAYILRNRGLELQLLLDFEKVQDFVENGYRLPKAEAVKYAEIPTISHFLDRMDEKDSKVAMVGFDTETQGLDWLDPNFLMLSYQLSTKAGTAAVVRFYEEVDVKDADFVIFWPRQLPWSKKKEPVEVGIRRLPNFEKKIDELERFLAHPKVKKYMTNGNFDLHALEAFFLRERGYRPKVVGYVMDLQAAAQLLDENVFQQASLSDLQFSFTDMKVDYNAEFARKYDKADMLSVPVESFVQYGGADADCTYRVAQKIRENLLSVKKNRRLARYLAKFVMPTLTKSLFVMERNGAWIDKEELPKTTKKVKEAAEKHSSEALKVVPASIKECEEHVKKGLKLTRSQLVSDTLFSKKGFGIKPWKKTKGGDAWSTDKEVRKRLLEQKISKRAAKFIKEFNEWQELYTLWSRYLRGFEKYIKRDGCIHSSLSITTAVTGRVASSNPNTMNNPKRSKSAHLIRRLIAAPPGWLMLKADQVQSELRWAAEVADEKNMKRVFAKGLDLHMETAKGLIRQSGKKWEQLTKAEKKDARQKAKPVNFGLLYLMTPWGFVRYCFTDYGLVITEDTAKKYIDAFFSMYPGLRTYQKETIAFCRRHGYVESVLGRRRRLPEITSKNDKDRAEAERQAVNHLIQSPSSDVVLMAGNEIVDADPNPEEFRLSLFVHDELISLVHEDADVEMYGRLVKEAMENPPLKRDFGYEMSVPLVADVEIGPNLAETKILEL